MIAQPLGIIMNQIIPPFCIPFSSQYEINNISIKQLNVVMQEPRQQKIIILKQREKQRDQAIIQEWRNKRSRFFSEIIVNKLKDAGATEQQISQISQKIVKKEEDIKHILTYFFKQEKLKKYKQPVKQILKLFISMQKQYEQRKGECSPILQIINMKYSTLQIIRIQYQQKIGDLGYFKERYYVSAIELFKVVHENKLLTQITLKGIQIKNFEYFYKLLNPQNKDIYETERDRIGWIKYFCPSKLLKLILNVKVELHMKEFKKNILISIIFKYLKYVCSFGVIYHLNLALINNFAVIY